jgi:predicted amidohydrolase YtcJ
MVRIGAIKILADGSLGAHTAAFKEPYSDQPESTGMMLYTAEELGRLVIQGHEADFQLAIHAIGDYAVETVLNTLDEALSRAPKENHRHRVEHASVLSENAIRHMKRLNLIASVQPHFVVSDFWAADRVGPERARWVYPFKSLITEGITVAGGSDCPVEPINPLFGIQAAVARETLPEERITVNDALRMYTINGAYASFEDDAKGSIEAGKLADLIVLSKNPLTVESDKIRDIAVEMTIIGGKIVHRET